MTTKEQGMARTGDDGDQARTNAGISPLRQQSALPSVEMAVFSGVRDGDFEEKSNRRSPSGMTTKEQVMARTGDDGDQTRTDAGISPLRQQSALPSVEMTVFFWRAEWRLGRKKQPQILFGNDNQKTKRPKDNN